jgi:DNA-binding response OmpR family regulator
MNREVNGQGSKRILVIDDNAEIREFIAKLLSQAGVSADTAGDGEEGWKSVRSTGYEMVITDHQMPKLTGLNFIRRLREDSIEAPCILLSASLPEPKSTLTQLINPGAVLTKPFRPADLLETVYSLLQGGSPQTTQEA